jgi:creatinine amidohydrolase
MDPDRRPFVKPAPVEDSAVSSAALNMGDQGLWIESLTWMEVEAALKRYDTLLIPLGAQCKEHGPHLPLNTDWLYADYLARRVVAACRVLAIPTVPLGHYPAFAEYPGSVSLRADTFRDMILDILRSFTRHGIRKCFILNTGISTLAPLARAREELAGEAIRMEFLDLSRAALSVRKSVEQQARGTHADEIETSNLLYIAPEVVRLDKAVPELAPPRDGPLTRDLNSGAGVPSTTGSWGNPLLATAEKGKLLTEAIIAEIIHFLHAQFGV